MKKKSTLRILLEKKDTDACIFVYGIFIALFLGIVGILSQYLMRRYTPALVGICPFKMLTGIDCPGCGGTRAFIALLHGDIIASFKFNPFIIYAAVISLIFYISQFLRFITHERIHGFHLHIKFIIWGAVILAVNWIIHIIMILI